MFSFHCCNHGNIFAPTHLSKILLMVNALDAVVNILPKKSKCSVIKYSKSICEILDSGLSVRGAMSNINDLNNTIGRNKYLTLIKCLVDFGCQVLISFLLFLRIFINPRFNVFLFF